MRVFDKTKTQELKEYDLEKGYLKNDVLVKILPEQQEQKEISHFETLAEFPNGGKSVIKVIEKEGVPYLPEREEKEVINVYVEYTAEELQKIANKKEIVELEQWFKKYYSVYNEHACCQRIGIECNHNIEEWDIQADKKARRLKELRGV